MTDEEIRAATVGEPHVLGGTIELRESDPVWPGRFTREAARIAAVLGERALRIEHIGSTSVPGLAAKPIIDVLLVVAAAGDEAAYVDALEAGGYVLRIRESDPEDHRMFKGPDTDVNLHVLSQGSPEIERYVRFRDRLRESRTDRERYERAKRGLAGKTWTYVQNYADAKSTVVEEILARALDERHPESPSSEGAER